MRGGVRYPDQTDWEGMQGAVKGDRIGMAIDLDEGSMTVYKNGERLGVIQSGLNGEYVWAACFFRGTVRIAGNSQGAGDFDPAFTEACLKWKLKSLRERESIPAAAAIELRDWFFSPEAAYLGQMPAEEEAIVTIVHESTGMQVLDLKNAQANGRTALLRALAADRPTIAKALLNLGANPHATDDDDKDCMDLVANIKDLSLIHI